MVHHHTARNTHFNLRLEMEGVFRSWDVFPEITHAVGRLPYSHLLIDG